MLRVARVREGTGRYYLSDLAHELDEPSADLRHDRSVGNGRWWGAGAAGLGLRGSVDGERLGAVLSGRHPSGRHSLRARDAGVCAYDLVFAAPKSVSVLFALGGRETAAAVRAAHEAAVEDAMAYVGSHAAAVRVTATRERTTSRVDGLVAAWFTHGVSRALDPHLHSHVVVANLAHGDDGRWRAVDGRGLYAHARAAGAVYDASLRHGLGTRLGLEWQPRTPRGWEVAGVDRVLVGALSGRRAEILAHAHSHARPHSARSSPSGRAHAVAWAATRGDKSPVQSAEDLRARWASVAEDLGWSTALVRDGSERAAPGSRRDALDEHRFAAGIFDREARGVARRDVVAGWAEALEGGAGGGDVERCVALLADWGTMRGVAERLHPPRAVVPPPHVLRLLGPRPASPDGLTVWTSAASAVERYRRRWGVDDHRGALGADTPAALRAFPARRLADHLTTTRTVDDALVTLGRHRERERRRERGLDVGMGLGRDA